MNEEKLKKIAIMARTTANLDPDVIRLWTKYHDKVHKLDKIGDKKADDLVKEWECIFKGFVQILLPRDLSDEEYDYIISYLWK